MKQLAAASILGFISYEESTIFGALLGLTKKMLSRKKINMSYASHSGTKKYDVNKVNSDQSIDFFSSLPDNVLSQIFSLLTMREAFYTCVSCRKLKHLMTSIPCVEIQEINADGCPIKKKEFIESVSRFLENHDGVVRKFQLSCSPGVLYLSDILHWFSLVVKNGIEEIVFVINDALLYPPIPASVLTAETLKVLKLRNCDVDNLSFITGLKSLKSLLLGDMYIPNDVMDLICCHCDSLQNLTLENCIGFKEIKIVDPRSKLEALTLDGPYWRPFRLNVLITVNLKTLVIRSGVMTFSFTGCPHIEDLVLYRGSAREITEEESENVKVNVFNKLPNVKSLHLTGWSFECFSAYRAIQNHQLTNLKLLDLDFVVCLHNQKELNNLISSAKNLKTLFIWSKRNYCSRDSSIYNNRNFERVFANLLDIKYEVNPTVGFRNIAGGSSYNLQNIDIKDFLGTIYEVSYIKFVLANFHRLRVIKVTPIEGMDEEQSRAYEKLISRFPRVSTDVSVLVGTEEVWKAEEA